MIVSVFWGRLPSGGVEATVGGCDADTVVKYVHVFFGLFLFLFLLFLLFLPVSVVVILVGVILLVTVCEVLNYFSVGLVRVAASSNRCCLVIRFGIVGRVGWF